MSRCTVLLLGDSISLGYRDLVRNKLSKCCKVLYPKEQGKGITDLYRMIYEWRRDIVKGDKVNLVYWNAGLWDVVRIFGEKPQTEVETYIHYVRALNNRLKHIFPDAKICFASTTAVLEDRYNSDFYRLNTDIDLYNNKCLNELGCEIEFFDDLHEVSLAANDDDYVDATHFKYFFNKKICDHVCDFICKTLEKEIQSYEVIYKDASMRRKKWLERLADHTHPKVLIWGFNDVYKIYKPLFSEYSDIIGIIDRDKRIQGIISDNVSIISPESIEKYDASAIISVLNDDVSNGEILDFCNEHNMVFVQYHDFASVAWPLFEERMLKHVEFRDCSPDVEHDMVKYIGINVKENLCNLDCVYCYLSLNPKRRTENIRQKNPHDPRYVRYCLRREIVGGSCLIGITGTGETMLADKIQEICVELLKEGHYLHIVTNGICINQISDLIRKAGRYSKHIFFKLSFHYLELKKRNLLNAFTECVKLIEQSEASFSIELMPHDEIDELIPEIQYYSLKHFGAYPHLTIGRDDKRNARLLTSLTAKEYFSKWSSFESPMFDLKREHYMKKEDNCQAGRLSCYIDLISGKITRCYFKEDLSNLYFDEPESLDFENVKGSCPIEYCYNCHIFGPLNILRGLDGLSYSDVRDRITADGSHWLKEDMRRFLNVKLQ